MYFKWHIYAALGWDGLTPNLGYILFLYDTALVLIYMYVKISYFQIHLIELKMLNHMLKSMVIPTLASDWLVSSYGPIRTHVWK